LRGFAAFFLAGSESASSLLGEVLLATVVIAIRTRIDRKSIGFA
jgi:hypothetical protein